MPAYREIRFRAEADQIERLAEISAESGVSVAELCRQAIVRFLGMKTGKYVETPILDPNDDPNNPLD